MPQLQRPTWRSGKPHSAPSRRSFPPQTPNPEGEVWGPTSVAVDGAFLEQLRGGVVDVLSRAAIEGRGFGQMLLGLSNGVVARIPMTATAYPPARSRTKYADCR
jgi:hypothetical protein